MKKVSLLFLAFLVTGVLAVASQVSLTGDWTYTMTTQRGEIPQDMKIVQEGDKIKVTMVGQRGETTGEGTVKDKAVEWTVVRTTQRGEMKIVFKGEIVDENNLKGTMEGGFGGGGGGQAPVWKAVRKPK
ncbi:MAG: hypothetical protein FJY80_03045 [Candidatus Aminicenantes bacterium]|nr:hypothetical protein [Candidatus Aminicenantes bacterium]